MRSTRLTQIVRAPRAVVYRALLDPAAIAAWRVPDGMTSEVHAFDAREGGAFRISLTYVAADASGKSGAHTDTFHGRFVRLVPDERVVEAIEFETDDAALQGEMVMTTTLRDVVGGTEVTLQHDKLPPGLSEADNETGTRMALAKLAAFVEEA